MENILEKKEAKGEHLLKSKDAAKKFGVTTRFFRESIAKKHGLTKINPEWDGKNAYWLLSELNNLIESQKPTIQKP